MDDFYSLEKLEVFQIANEIGDIVWNVVSTWNYFEKDTIGKQFVRCSDSISANIGKVTEDIFLKKTYNFVITQEGL